MLEFTPKTCPIFFGVVEEFSIPAPLLLRALRRTTTHLHKLKEAVALASNSSLAATSHDARNNVLLMIDAAQFYIGQNDLLEGMFGVDVANDLIVEWNQHTGVTFP